MLRCTAIAALGVLAAACGAMATSDVDPDLGGASRYELRITHELDRASGVVDPGELEARHFTPIDDGPRYEVFFSEEGAEVELRPVEAVDSIAVLSGWLVPDGPAAANVESREHRSYFLDEGFFAAGQLVIWEEPHGLRAELTAYGSGLPMVGSWRGDLLPLE